MILLKPIKEPIRCQNLSGGHWQQPSGTAISVTSPYTGKLIGTTAESDTDQLNQIVEQAHQAFSSWKAVPIKERCAVLFQWRQILIDRLDLFAQTAANESGKTPAEAKAGVLKGIEVLEYALSLQNLDQGAALEVSRGVTCTQSREPMGVVLGIVPFNFPAMVPMWMIPIAIALGNSFILKPSEKVPLTSQLLGQSLIDAGLPPGVFSIANGTSTTVKSLLAMDKIRVVGFVGSTAAARAVYGLATAIGKRCLALGGAKNHIILAPDADLDMAVSGVVSSFTGCAGQRCMAASVLIAVGNCQPFIDQIAHQAQSLRLGEQMGALINQEARERLFQAIDQALAQGAKIIVDGRDALPPKSFEGGYWLGPTILDRVTPTMACAQDELFGPVLTIIRAATISEALAIDQASPYGNATSVFTQNGAVARLVASASQCGMVGVNIGVPVPREPFSFGGSKQSKFGQGDITGNASLDLWTQLKKVTIKWTTQQDTNWMS